MADRLSGIPLHIACNSNLNNSDFVNLVNKNLNELNSIEFQTIRNGSEFEHCSPAFIPKS